jgi:hypothetical protein
MGQEAGWLAQEFIRYDRAFGDPEAVDLAAKLMRYIMGEMGYFDANGKFLGPEGMWPNQPADMCHFHSHTMQIVAALEVVRRTGDKELLGRAIKAYAAAVAAGDPLTGYFPEWIEPSQPKITCETCEVADMVTAGILFSKLGIDKWDDVDRWVRNQLVENQMTSTNWLTDGHLDLVPFQALKPMQGDVRRDHLSTTDRVAERTVGLFTSWATPNDFVGHPDHLRTSVLCCSINGARGLYYAWANQLSYEGGKLRIHLLLNRASKWADVNSHLPYDSRVDVQIKRDLDLEVRIPEWVKPEEVQCEMAGARQTLSFDGRYAKVGSVKAGQTVVVRFPIVERTTTVKIQGAEYTLIRRGNDIVSIAPAGKYCPLYQNRGHYRLSRTLWKKGTCFVSDEEFSWW